MPNYGIIRFIGDVLPRRNSSLKTASRVILNNSQNIFRKNNCQQNFWQSKRFSCRIVCSSSVCLRFCL